MIYFLLVLTGVAILFALSLCGYMAIRMMKHSMAAADDMTRKLMTQIPGLTGNAQELLAIRDTRTKRSEAKLHQPAPSQASEPPRQEREPMPFMVPPPPTPMDDLDGPDQIYPSSGSGIK